MDQPTYRPYGNQVLSDDYYPSVIFSISLLPGAGDGNHLYKMWHQAPNEIAGPTLAVSDSDGGTLWTLVGKLQFTDSSYVIGSHPAVVYNVKGFSQGSGVGPYLYKMWYWTGTATPDVSSLKAAGSNDGLNWTSLGAITQDVSQPLVDGTLGSFFYNFEGPGCVIYNPTPINIPGRPFTYAYVMYYDLTSGTTVNNGSSLRTIGLAYSIDGLKWYRYGSAPVLIPKGSGSLPPSTSSTYGWDDTFVSRASVVNDGTIYHAFYTGSNQNFAGNPPELHGIGHAISRDGATWSEDWSNPLFYYNNGISWRSGRTHAPSVFYHVEASAFQMWFNGGTGALGTNQGIGYASS